VELSFETRDRAQRREELGLSEKELEELEEANERKMYHHTNFQPIWQDINRKKNEYYLTRRAWLKKSMADENKVYE
jgi:hypothetical protein